MTQDRPTPKDLAGARRARSRASLRSDANTPAGLLEAPWTTLAGDPWRTKS
jgi:hypothetical protein